MQESSQSPTDAAVAAAAAASDGFVRLVVAVGIHCFVVARLYYYAVVDPPGAEAGGEAWRAAGEFGSGCPGDAGDSEASESSAVAFAEALMTGRN